MEIPASQLPAAVPEGAYILRPSIVERLDWAVSFGNPGAVELEHTQPLTLTTSLGQRLTAKNISRNVLTDTLSATNVGQYDVMPVLSQLKAEIPLQLTLKTIRGSVVKLPVPPSTLQEWQTLATLEA